MADTITGIEGKKNAWVVFVLVAILLFFINLGLRFMFEKKIDIFWSIMVTLFFIVAYFLLTMFLNIRKT